MRYWLLFVFSLVLLVVPSARAQQQTPPNATAANSADASSPANANARLTPRQMAELHADLFMAEKEYSDAIRAYKKLLETDPRDPELLDKTGVAYQELLNLRLAENYYKKATKADKTYASALNNIGTVEYTRKHYKKAIDYYKKALKIRSDNASFFTNLGYAYFETKQYPEAITAFQQALLIEPDVFQNRGEGGAIVQQRASTDPGLFYFYVAKSFALSGNAAETAHFLKMSRDDGYKDFTAAAKDPAFAKVIKDPRVQAVLTVTPVYATDQKKTVRD